MQKETVDKSMSIRPFTLSPGSSRWYEMPWGGFAWSKLLTLSPMAAADPRETTRLMCG